MTSELPPSSAVIYLSKKFWITLKKDIKSGENWVKDLRDLFATATSLNIFEFVIGSANRDMSSIQAQA